MAVFDQTFLFVSPFLPVTLDLSLRKESATDEKIPERKRPFVRSSGKMLSMSPCQDCHSGCCRAFAIPVTGADLIRIEGEMGHGFFEVACRWEDRDNAISCGVVPHFHFADEPETPFAICLKHEASSIFRRTTRCHFLVESPPDGRHPLGTAHCGAYASRPLVCRVYPTKLAEGGMHAELHEVPPHGRPNEPHPIYSLCQRPWTISDIDAITAVQDLVLMQFELRFFQQVAAVWNRYVSEFEVFPDFLKEVYRSRVVYETREGLSAAIPGGVASSLSLNRRAA